MAEGRRWQKGDPVPDGYVLCRKDELPARNQGPWARKKLAFLDEYLPAALRATKQLRGHTYYLDLFAGPGRNAWREVSQQFRGSPIRALEASTTFRGESVPTGFDHFHFCNLDPLDHELLCRRLKAARRELEGKMELGEIHTHLGDSNELIYDLLKEIPEYAFIVAFADIEGPSNLPFKTLQALSARHEKVDLYLMYPSGSLERLFSYDREKRKKYHSTVTRFFGTNDWKPLVEARPSEGQASQLRRNLLDRYKRRLETLWEFVEDQFRVQGPRGYYYHMLFATNKEFADDIAGHVAKAGQRSLELGDT